MQQLYTTTEQNSDCAHQAGVRPTNAGVIADQGGLVVNNFVDRTQSIRESSVRISDVISLIDGSAFQVDLLAP